MLLSSHWSHIDRHSPSIHPSIISGATYSWFSKNEWKKQHTQDMSSVHHMETMRHTGQTTTPHTTSPHWHDFEGLVDLICIFLYCGRKLEYRETTLVCTKRTRKFQDFLVTTQHCRQLPNHAAQNTKLASFKIFFIAKLPLELLCWKKEREKSHKNQLVKKAIPLPLCYSSLTCAEVVVLSLCSY